MPSSHPSPLAPDHFYQTRVLDQYRPIIDKFRSLVRREFPQLKEEMRGGTEKYYGVPVYRYNKIVLTVSPTKQGITFSFSEGKRFADKYHLLEGLGNKTLNLRISSLEQYGDDLLRYYLQQAIELDEKS